MTRRTLLGLPVDGRPVVGEQVQMLVENAGWRLRLPALETLGHLRSPAQRETLRAWLEAEAGQADGVVLSLDMLVYGGLVPSRFIDDPLHDLQARLDWLRAFKAAHPALPVYAFMATMRISNNDVSEEEKAYWNPYGRRIWAWSWHTDRHQMLGDPADAAAAQAAAEAIPPEVLADYQATRARNFALNEQALALVADGVIERLVLPQDDTAAFGVNIAERRRMEAAIAPRGLGDKVLVYPGADEVMHTLCAHLVARQEQLAPLAFHVLCSDPAKVAQLSALYEDRPVLDAVASQVAAVGGRLVERIEDADVVLGLHTCGTAQGDWAMQKPLPAPHPVDPAWCQRLAALCAAGRAVALLDLAYANGGDPAMLGALAKVLPLRHLAAYAGWNTASNSIGSLVAQCVLARGAYAAAGNRKVLALRLLEDLLYQAVLRQVVRLGVAETRLDASALRTHVDQVFRAHADAWARGHGLGVALTDIDLPWDRTFEIGLRLKAQDANDGL